MEAALLLFPMAELDAWKALDDGASWEEDAATTKEDAVPREEEISAREEDCGVSPEEDTPTLLAAPEEEMAALEEASTAADDDVRDVPLDALAATLLLPREEDAGADVAPWLEGRLALLETPWAEDAPLEEDDDDVPPLDDEELLPSVPLQAASGIPRQRASVRWSVEACVRMVPT